ncbi:hypothetical protein H6F67_03890 [Microcoleus sp. FACHB-1515]|uniref:hypothetical protein n=1 Tax=Cyanophyceae TaxID=3028117 RepID=UPI001689AA86|nr:hypothetical protein [Microcoleus sp. FACHB-1515]MBD2088994.1 hypothetical protein [Microcoleus sp. FACHB-1515]
MLIRNFCRLPLLLVKPRIAQQLVGRCAGLKLNGALGMSDRLRPIFCLKAGLCRSLGHFCCGDSRNFFELGQVRRIVRHWMNHDGKVKKGDYKTV